MHQNPIKNAKLTSQPKKKNPSLAPKNDRRSKPKRSTSKTSKKQYIQDIYKMFNKERYKFLGKKASKGGVFASQKIRSRKSYSRKTPTPMPEVLKTEPSERRENFDGPMLSQRMKVAQSSHKSKRAPVNAFASSNSNANRPRTKSKNLIAYENFLQNLRQTH
jgi:hypothetical protein